MKARGKAYPFAMQASSPEHFLAQAPQMSYTRHSVHTFKENDAPPEDMLYLSQRRAGQNEWRKRRLWLGNRKMMTI